MVKVAARVERETSRLDIIQIMPKGISKVTLSGSMLPAISMPLDHINVCTANIRLSIVSS